MKVLLDVVFEVVTLHAIVAEAGVGVLATAMANDNVAAVTANPVTGRNLSNGNDKNSSYLFIRDT